MLKKPITIDQQIVKLQQHGILIADKPFAKEILSRVNYYRFTGYALQYRIDPASSRCVPGTTFDQIYRIYCFDEKLRNSLRPSLEIIEVYLKTLIAYQFSIVRCVKPPHDQHYDRNNYYNKNGFDLIAQSFQREENYYRDSLIVQHHKSKYHGKMPLWVIMELLSFSNASKLYSAMYISDQDRIASSIGLGRQTLENNLHCLAVLRNKCAHGARLYNTRLNPPVHFNSSFLVKNPSVLIDTVFAYVLILLRRLPDQSQRVELFNSLNETIAEYKDSIDLSLIGFPPDYVRILKNSL